ncbi:hypothetical protein E2C01_095748 [Portunus trituberculatus]|uniref:Uncharacterized protein n=1 Tax=Portunus trituberculatus TaxID=210409 RepID=A0A5B7K174_PORTR|nr:hypothetical protein [Portunus trituberculatus]
MWSISSARPAFTRSYNSSASLFSTSPLPTIHSNLCKVLYTDGGGGDGDDGSEVRAQPVLRYIQLNQVVQSETPLVR